MLSAQTLVPAGRGPVKHDIRPFTPNLSSHQGSSRGINEVYVDYFSNEFNEASNAGSQAFYLSWQLNNAFDVSCTPVDTVDFASLKWAGVRFDSIFDALDGTVYDRSSLASMKVDSIFVTIAEHQNNSGLEDTIVVRIMEVNTASVTGVNRGLTLQPGTSNITNNVLWSDTLFTDQGLASQIGTITFPVDSAGVNGIHIPDPTAGFIVMVDYYGPKIDTFFIADANNFACGSSELPTQSFVPRNSLSYINYNFVTTGCTDLSGVDDLVAGAGPCNLFYRQNMGISASITIDAPLSVNATSASNTGCPGATVTLNSNASGGSGSANYDIEWTGPNGSNFSTPFSSTTDVTLPNTNGPATFYVTVEDLGAGGVTITDSVIINVRAIFVNLGNDTTIACSDSVNISASVTGTTTGATFTWNDQSTGITYLNAKPGNTYSVTATNSSGCTATDSKVINQPITQTISYTVESSYANGTTTSVQPCADSVVSFTNTSSNTTGWNWEWEFGNGNTNFNVSPQTVYPNSGLYTVNLTADSAGCIVTAAPLTLTVLPATNALCTVVGINEADWLKDFVNIYPNPNAGSFVVDFSSINNENVSITVFNLVGQTVYTHDGFSVNNSAIETVNMSQMGNGFYFVRVTVGNDAFTTKISVQK